MHVYNIGNFLKYRNVTTTGWELEMTNSVRYTYRASSLKIPQKTIASQIPQDLLVYPMILFIFFCMKFSSFHFCQPESQPFFHNTMLFFCYFLRSTEYFYTLVAYIFVRRRKQAGEDRDIERIRHQIDNGRHTARNRHHKLCFFLYPRNTCSSHLITEQTNILYHIYNTYMLYLYVM